MNSNPKLGEIEIFILSNGVHTDIVLPIKNAHKDWSKSVKFEHIQLKDTLMKYLAFGWGDKGFYLETPTWAELKFSVAFKAVFHLSTTAIHATFYKDLKESTHCKKIFISKDDYVKLVSYIEESFMYDKNKNVILIPNHSYSNTDCFYEAEGVYSLFYTCNTWANNALKYSNQKSCLWTAFDKGIFYHYKKTNEMH